jgi:rod shape-determining protein MreD
MIGESYISGWRVLFSVFGALALAIVPLPHVLAVLRPDFLLLVVVYWSLTAPRIAGLMFAWLCGLAIDALHGVVLGQHALAFLLVAGFAHHWQLRMRIFPVWQQASVVFIMLIAYQAIVFWIDGIVGQPVVTWMRWLPVLTGALSWPFLVAILDTWNRRRR